MATRKVSELMRRERARLQVDEEVSVRNLRRALARTRYLPVVDDQRKFQGFVTRTDLLGISEKSDDDRVEVRSLLRTATPIRMDQPLEAAAAALLKSGAHVLPVVEADGRFVGMISDHGILRTMVGRQRPPARESSGVLVDSVMTRDPESISPEDSVERAAGTMLEAGIRHLPVVDDDGRVLGIVSERDLRERIGADEREWFRAAASVLEDSVDHLMTPDPAVIRSGTSLLDAVEILERDRVGALPVVDDDDRLVGILSYIDVLDLMRDALARRRAAFAAEPPSATQ
jgi:CBS domain-containing protein